MKAFIENIQIENNLLRDTLEEVKAENRHLKEEKILLEKANEKRKIFHRKYVDDVETTEAIRIQDFNKEKKELMDEIKKLTKDNRQHIKDVDFYKKAHEELAKCESSMVGSSSESIGNIQYCVQHLQRNPKQF